MRRLIFDPEQRNWLITLLIGRLGFLSYTKAKGKYSNHTANAILKLDVAGSIILSGWERATCASVIKVQLNTLYQRINICTISDLMSADIGLQTYLHEVDLGKAIMSLLEKIRPEPN